MTQIDAFRGWYTATVASVFGAITSSWLPIFAQQFGTPATFGLTLVSLLFVVLAFQKILDRAIDSSLLIRRLILGGHFVEGYWLDYAVRGTTGQVLSAALLHISYEDGSLSVNGLVVGTEHQAIAAFEGYPATLVRLKLGFSYQLHSTNREMPVEHGYEELQFTSHGRLPSSYTGYFIDTRSRSVVTLHGNKVEKPEEIRKVRDNNQRERFVRDYLTSMSG